MSKIKFLIDQYKAINVQAKATLWYTICNLFQNGISFLTIPIYTRMLTTSEYGEYTVFQSWREILVIFATLNLYCGIFTKAMVDHEDDRDRYTSAMQGLSTLLTVAMFVIYLTAADFWNHILDMDSLTVLLMLVQFICFPAFNFWAVRQRVEYKYIAMVAVTMCMSILTPALSLYLLFFTELRAEAVIYGYLAVQIVFGGFFYVYHFIKGKVFFVKEYWMHGLKFNIPLIPHYLSIMVLGQADRIMIKKYCGDEKAGIYSLAYQVSMIMSIFINAINGSMVPWVYESLKKKSYKGIADISTKLCLLIGIMTLGASMIAPEIIWILGSDKYVEAIWVIPVVALGVYFTFCYSLFSNVEFYYGETQYIMTASSSGAVLNIILNAVCIPKFGYIAAGYTTLVCYICFAVAHYMITVKIAKKYKIDEALFDIPKLLLLTAVLVVGTILCMVLYNFTLLRYAMILTAAAIVLLNLKKIVNIVAGLKG